MAGPGCSSSPTNCPAKNSTVLSMCGGRGGTTQHFLKHPDSNVGPRRILQERRRTCWTRRAVLFFTLLLTTSSLTQRARKLSGSASPISTIQAQASFSAQQFAGTWLLVAVGSACRFLQEQGHRAEATTLHTAPQGAAMAVSTFRKLDGICWQVRQLFGDTGVPGRFLLQAPGGRAPVHVVVAETDYQNFAILYLEKARKLSVKLYVRSLPVSDSALDVFEQRVRGANLTEHQIFFFPKYGFCKTTDQFHILNEVPR
ncbi:complement component C8 gamma chain isoform X2 [Mesocricetus auratus]|uniref:Complement component C8 gamma chain isoform X2 n=1 Tax=Mesocricetus auratus TaxID=10036 RepID=A0ABM2XEH2_MESAU|nr:complement component C8 gamma chain isoform X2 [Mesocricetus auratus]